MSLRKEGIVQLGDLTAYASWTNGEILSLKFPTRSFRRDQWQVVEFLRHCSDPLFLVCDGKATSGTRIIGYEHERFGDVSYRIRQQS